jgi:hypothetical protein
VGLIVGQMKNSVENRCKLRLPGGEGGIRTLGTLARSPVFETGLFNHSSTSPIARAFAPAAVPGRFKWDSGAVLSGQPDQAISRTSYSNLAIEAMQDCFLWIRVLGPAGARIGVRSPGGRVG